MGTQLKYQPIDFDAERRMFTQAVMLFGRKVSVASAPTRIAADQAAAKRLLKNLGRTKPTCFLIRLARQAKDQLSLSKLQATRAAQVLEGTEEACTKNIV